MANFRTKHDSWPTLTSCLLLAIVLSGIFIQIEAQFFTKSSKSIPRMGRRSELPTMNRVEMRRHLLETILSDLNAQASNPNAITTGEFATPNDQPFDINPDFVAQWSRNERSPGSRDGFLGYQLQQQQSRNSQPSLSEPSLYTMSSDGQTPVTGSGNNGRQ